MAKVNIKTNERNLWSNYEWTEETQILQIILIYSKPYFENFNNVYCTGPQKKVLFHPQSSCDMLYADLLLRSVKEMQKMLIFFLLFCMTVTFYVNFICSLSSQSQNILWEAEWCHFSHSIIFQLLEQDILWHILQYFLKVVKYKLKVIYLCMRGLHCLFQLLELNSRLKWHHSSSTKYFCFVT